MARKAKERIVCQHFAWCLFRRGDVWYADGRHNRPSLGKHSLATRDRGEALEQLRRLDLHKATELGITKQQEPIKEASEISIKAGWEQYLAHISRPDVLGGAGVGTQKRYRAVRDKHQLFCVKQGLTAWCQVDKKHIAAYGTHLAKNGYADASVYLECTLLKQIIKWMIEEERLLPESHRVRLSLRRSEQSDTYCPSREQVKTIIERCESMPPLKWLANVIMALVTTGMRIGELAALRWTDIDLNIGVIMLPDNRHSGRHKNADAVRRTKGRRSRQIPVHSRLSKILQNLPRRTDGLVFSGPNGGRLRPNSACRILIRDIIAPLKAKFPTPEGEIGFVDCRLHSFRHAFVSQAFLDGVSEGEIRSWVGHTNSRIVERYRHLRNEDAQRKMQQIKFFEDGADSDAGVLPGAGPDQQTDHDEIPKGDSARPGVPDGAATLKSGGVRSEQTDEKT
jgi:integrase